jgi:hypothetical protein
MEISGHFTGMKSRLNNLSVIPVFADFSETLFISFAIRFLPIRQAGITRIQGKQSISGFGPTIPFLGLKPNIVVHSFPLG